MLSHATTNENGFNGKLMVNYLIANENGNNSVAKLRAMLCGC